jgi:hypothetical protein
MRTSIEAETRLAPALVFLDLLKGQPQHLGQLVLADLHVPPLDPDAGSNRDVDGVWTGRRVQGAFHTQR